MSKTINPQTRESIRQYRNKKQKIEVNILTLMSWSISVFTVGFLVGVWMR